MSAFKLGDKVVFSTAAKQVKDWYRPNTIVDNNVHTITKLFSGSDVELDGLARWSTVHLESFSPLTDDPLADTLKTIDDKIKAAEQRNVEITALKRAETARITDEQAKTAKRMKELKAEQRKLDKVIIQYGNQITKLRELEQEETETPNIQVGDTVTVIGESYTGQYGTVEEVRATDHGTFSIKVYGGFVTANGYKIPEVLFAERELQVVAR